MVRYVFTTMFKSLLDVKNCDEGGFGEVRVKIFKQQTVAVKEYSASCLPLTSPPTASGIGYSSGRNACQVERAECRL